MNDQDAVAADPVGGDCPTFRLVLVAEYYDSGGTRTYLKQLLDFYAMHGVWVCLVGIQANPDAEIQELLAKYRFSYVAYSAILKPTSQPTGSLRPPVWWAPSVWGERKAFAGFLRDIRARAIVVSAGTPGQFLGAAGAAGGIYILHTYPHGRRQQLLARFVLAPFARRVTKFVAVSKYQQRAMRKLWRIRDSERCVAVIRNTTGPSRDEDLELPLSPPRVLTASWVEAYKEPFHWLEIAVAVSQRMGRENVQFVWFGEGSMLEACRMEASRVQDVADVCFAAHAAALAGASRRATLYLQTSSTENMSLSVIDALRFGLPTVGTRVGGLPEIINDQVTGVLVPPRDVNAAVEAIASLLQDSEARSAMGKASRLRYAEHFSESNWHRQLDDVHSGTFSQWSSASENA